MQEGQIGMKGWGPRVWFAGGQQADGCRGATEAAGAFNKVPLDNSGDYSKVGGAGGREDPAGQRK